MIEPIPCPFCGSENIMAEGQENWVAMVCQHCHAQGPKLFSNEDAFIKHPVETVTTLWNRDNPLPETEVLHPGWDAETVIADYTEEKV